MSQKIYVEELKQHLNKEIISEFLVTQKDLREGTKDFYIRMNLADKTGALPGNVWNNAKVISEKFKEGDVIQVKAMVISYKSQIQLTVNKISRVEPQECDLTEFMEATGKDMNKLSDKLFGYIDGIGNSYLKELLLVIFDDKEFYTAFAKAPAAKSWHHNYLGGLLEHTVSVAAICDFMSLQYPLDRDLLVTGAILHDLGKVFEYEVKGNIEFSIIGRLVGHIPLADQFVCEKAAGVNNFPKDLLMKIRHLILAHHGEYEKASARLPQTLEAVALHHADNMDAQTVGVIQITNRMQKDGAIWSEFDRLNERFYYLK